MPRSADPTIAALIPAAQYLRMSTEHQRYSLEHQSVWIAAYAAEHGYEIVRTYSDAGKSGLRLEGRQALADLLKDVVGGEANYRVILVLDVSRWGRFQDPDQAAHYEFICKFHGVRVVYCAEPFEDDNSVMSALMKQFKRAMAAEYSRELSIKIARVQRELAAKGYRQGGAAGFGFRRLVLDETGAPYQLLGPGQTKAVHGHRVILTPGPPEQVETVRRIFRLYVIAGLSEDSIVAQLNAEGSRPEPGRLWTRARINRMLNDEKYVGVNVFGRNRKPLAKTTQYRNPPSSWVRVPDAFEPLVDRRLFEAVQQQPRRRSVRISTEQMLTGLRALWNEKGHLDTGLIDGARHLPCTATYVKRFGTLTNAYRLIGYRKGGHSPYFYRSLPDDEMLGRLADLLAAEGKLSSSIIDMCPDLPSAESYKRRFGSLVAAYERIGYQPTGVGASRRRRGRHYSDEEMLTALAALLAKKGTLSFDIINASDLTPCASAYSARFGGLDGAYERVGWHRDQRGSAFSGTKPER